MTWPGIGQLCLGRNRTGLLLAGAFAVLVNGIVNVPGFSVGPPVGLIFAGVLTWVLGILDVLVYRQVGSSRSDVA